MTDHLLSPVRIGSMTLRNRIVMAPMGVEIVGDDGSANDEVVRYYEERARGGAGLLITEVAAFAYPHGANSVHQLGLSEDRFVEPLRTLTDRVHAHGAKIAIQLVHHGTARFGRPTVYFSCRPVGSGRPHLSSRERSRWTPGTPRSAPRLAFFISSAEITKLPSGSSKGTRWPGQWVPCFSPTPII